MSESFDTLRAIEKIVREGVPADIYKTVEIFVLMEELERSKNKLDELIKEYDKEGDK